MAINMGNFIHGMEEVEFMGLNEANSENTRRLRYPQVTQLECVSFDKVVNSIYSCSHLVNIEFKEE